MKYTRLLFFLFSAAVLSGRPLSRRMAPAVPLRGQLQPTSNRYREIQSALAAKGYLSTKPSGTWDKDSISAMRRFQEDQNLEPTGKINARSLEALGLGPSKTADGQP